MSVVVVFWCHVALAVLLNSHDTGLPVAAQYLTNSTSAPQALSAKWTVPLHDDLTSPSFSSSLPSVANCSTVRQQQQQAEPPQQQQQPPHFFRRLQSQLIFDYMTLPSWLRIFLEDNFQRYFPPTPITPTSRPTSRPTPRPSGLTQFQTDLLNTHNRLRSSAGVQPLKWHSSLEEVSRKYIRSQDVNEQCRFEHSKKSLRTRVGPFSNVGENLYITNGRPTGRGVVEKWFSEIDCYRYGTVGDKCTRWRGPKCNFGTIMVGHLTQLLWATTTHVGCSVHKCQNCSRICPATYVSCTYGSMEVGYGGNLWGKLPFSSRVARQLGLGRCPSSQTGSVAGGSNRQAVQTILQPEEFVEGDEQDEPMLSTDGEPVVALIGDGVYVTLTNVLETASEENVMF
eukprot:GHVS01107487.1.p1 GENE.GHVS01107487.1~~GHVS01107487.1.p1  ORF type:complete len:397 (+),score=61.31 GHVS01107487.1:204-1394(+)